MISFAGKGDFRKVNSYFERVRNVFHTGSLDKYGEQGVEALRASTPVDSGLTADSWGYNIHRNGDQVSIIWTNSNLNDGVNIAVILQMGHGTGTGGYVEGIDYINPAMRPVFDNIAESAWKEVTSK